MGCAAAAARATPHTRYRMARSLRRGAAAAAAARRDVRRALLRTGRVLRGAMRVVTEQRRRDDAATSLYSFFGGVECRGSGRGEEWQHSPPPDGAG
eukprot:gene29077-42655_t